MCEVLPTLVAIVPNSSVVCFGMRLQRIQTCKYPVAFLALILRTVGHVGDCMNLQLRFVLELLIALITSEGLFIARMLVDHVTLQAMFMAQCHIA